MFAAWMPRGRPPSRGGPHVGSTAEQLLDRLTPFGGYSVVGVHAEESFVCAQALNHNTAESYREPVPSVCPVTGNVLVSWLRLDNRAELAADLHAGLGGDWNGATDPDLVLAAFRLWRTNTADRLEGDFAFALWEPARGSIYTARDSTGCKPLFYSLSDDLFAVGTTVAAFEGMAGVDDSASVEWLVRYAAGHSMDWDTTALVGVTRVRPGHWLLVDADSHEVVQFHRFVDNAPWADERDDRWVRDYRELLWEAVRRRLRSESPLGFENSGGLDSASILAIAADLEPGIGKTCHAFGFAPMSDEAPAMLLASKAAGVEQMHIFPEFPRPGGPIGARATRLLGHPVEQDNASRHASFYALARERGVRTLLSGHGGDEFVTNRGDQLALELLDHGQWRSAMREQSGRRLLRPARLAKRVIEVKVPSASTSRMAQIMMANLRVVPLRPEVSAEFEITQRVARTARLYVGRRAINEYVLVNRWQPRVSIRTEQCAVIAASYGVDYRWPLLDRRLIQQYLDTPAIEKAGNAWGRYLHRRSVAGIAPDAIVWRGSKAMGEPVAAPDFGLEIASFPAFEDLAEQLRPLVEPTGYTAMLRTPWPSEQSQRWARLAPLRAIAALSDWLESRPD